MAPSFFAADFTAKASADSTANYSAKCITKLNFVLQNRTRYFVGNRFYLKWKPDFKCCFFVRRVKRNSSIILIDDLFDYIESLASHFFTVIALRF
jgi:hypothetical protein